MTPHEAASTLADIRAYRSAAIKVRYRSSKLMRYRNELVALRRAGASYRELAFWLRRNHRLRADPTTIRRYLSQLPEIIEAGDTDDAELSETC